jgi:glutamate synthase (NADPH/NADH) small chain
VTALGRRHPKSRESIRISKRDKMSDNKKKLNLNRVSMPKQSPEERRHNFSEVALGYAEDQAAEEADRCIQ